MSSHSVYELTTREHVQERTNLQETNRSGVALGLLSSIRREILTLLNQRGSADIQELSIPLGCSPGTVRHHIGELRLRGLIKQHHEFGRTGVPGRPGLRFGLTPAGVSLFSPDDAVVATLALEILSEATTEPSADRVATRYFAGVLPAERVAGSATTPDLQTVADSLSQAGFYAEVEDFEPYGSVLSVFRCPIAEMARRFPAFCAAEHAAIAAAVDATDVKRVSHMASGGRFCDYRFKSGTSRGDIMATPPAASASGA